MSGLPTVLGDTVDAINSAQWGAGAYDAYGTGIPTRGYTPYPAVDPAQSNNASDATGPNPFMINKAIAPKVDGEIKVFIYEYATRYAGYGNTFQWH